MLYTLGYTGWTLPAIVEQVYALDAVLVDVRFMPFTRRREFIRKSFAEALADPGGRIRYQWVKAFGNVNYKDGTKPIQILDFEAGVHEIEHLMARRRALVLMCTCASPARCHRTVVVDKLAERFRLRVKHLTPATLTPSGQSELF